MRVPPISQFYASDQRPAWPGELIVVLDRGGGGGWFGCAGQVDDLCESEPQRLPGDHLLRVGADLWTGIRLAMPGLFSGLAWLNCLPILSDVGAVWLD